MAKNKNLKRKPAPLFKDKKEPKKIVEEPESDEEVNSVVKVMCLNDFLFVAICFFAGINFE